MTSTLTSHLLFEAGFSRIWWWALLEAQERTRLATCFVAFAQCPAGTDYGDIRKRDLTLGWNYNAPTAFNAEYASPRNSYMSSLSYVTGAHNMKVGLMWDTGYRTIDHADEQRRTPAAVSSRGARLGGAPDTFPP